MNRRGAEPAPNASECRAVAPLWVGDAVKRGACPEPVEGADAKRTGGPVMRKRRRSPFGRLRAGGALHSSSPP